MTVGGPRKPDEREWLVRKHVAPRRRQHRKVHPAMGTATGDIRVVKLISSREGNSTVPPDLLDQIPTNEQIGTVTSAGVARMFCIAAARPLSRSAGTDATGRRTAPPPVPAKLQATRLFGRAKRAFCSLFPTRPCWHMRSLSLIPTKCPWRWQRAAARTCATSCIEREAWPAKEKRC